MQVIYDENQHVYLTFGQHGTNLLVASQRATQQACHLVLERIFRFFLCSESKLTNESACGTSSVKMVF